jgi:hypothetical protein
VSGDDDVKVEDKDGKVACSLSTVEATLSFDCDFFSERSMEEWVGVGDGEGDVEADEGGDDVDQEECDSFEGTTWNKQHKMMRHQLECSTIERGR